MVSVVCVLWILTLLCGAAWSPVHAGQEARHWVFGNGSHIYFGPNGPVRPASNFWRIFSTEEGCATWSNPLTGALQICTDGRNVWNANGEMVENGFGLMGHKSSSQSALILPDPGNADNLYIFTAGVGPYISSSNSGIYYSIVNLKDNYVSTKNIRLLSPATEKLVATPHCNGRDYWVIAHEWGSDGFCAWLVTPTGIRREPIVSNVGTAISDAIDYYSIGNLKVSPDGRKIVSTGYYPDAVQLFDFNNSTGELSNPLTLPVSGSSYGASFSPDNTKLYITDQKLGPQSLIRLYQYTLTGTPAQILASRTLVFSMIGSKGDELGALQIAPDSKIYCARDGGAWLGVINNPNEAGIACDYVHNGVIVYGSFLGLPNFIDASFNTGDGCFPPEAAFDLDTTICAGMCLHIRDRSLNQPASWKWEFPGGEPAVFWGQHPQSICYATPGIYSVRLIVSNSKGSDTVEKRDVIVVRPRLGASAGDDVGICPGAAAVLSGSGGTVYRWEPTTGLEHPDSAVTVARPAETTTYVLTVRQDKCIDRDTVVVTVHEPPAANGGAYTLCRGASIQHNAAGSKGVYRWEPTEGVSNPDAALVELTPVQSTTYTVSLVDEYGCTTSAVVHIEVRDAGISAGADTVICPGGSVQLHATGISGQYRWEPADGLDNPTSAAPMATPAVTTLYVVTVTSGSCTAIDSVLVVVRDAPTVDAGADDTLCSGGVLRLRAVGTTGVYRWEPAEAVENANSASTLAYPLTTTAYRVVFTDEYGCSTSDEVTVVVDAEKRLNAGEDVRVCAGESVQLDAYIGEGVYQWTPAEGLDDPVSPRPRASPTTTTVYKLAVNTPGCVGEDSLTVYVLPPPDVDAGLPVQICAGDTVQLRVQTTGELVGWQPAAALDNALLHAPHAFPATTTEFVATVRSADGCLAQSSVVVTVVQPNAGIAETDTAICPGTEVVLHAVGEGPFLWKPESLVDNPRASVVRARPVGDTPFILLSRSGECEFADTVWVRERNTQMLRFAVADTVAVPGSQLSIPVFLYGDNTLPAGVQLSAEFTLSYNRRLIDVRSVTRGRILRSEKNGENGVIDVYVDNILTDEVQQGSVLTSIVVLPLLSARDTAVLSVDSGSVSIPGECVAVEGGTAVFGISDFCFPSDFRRFERPRVDVAPNPASELLIVDLRGMYGHTAELAVQSLWGSTVVRCRVAVPVSEEVVLDVASLPAGVYYLVVDCSGQRLFTPVCIVR